MSVWAEWNRCRPIQLFALICRCGPSQHLTGLLESQHEPPLTKNAAEDAAG